MAKSKDVVVQASDMHTGTDHLAEVLNRLRDGLQKDLRVAPDEFLRKVEAGPLRVFLHGSIQHFKQDPDHVHGGADDGTCDGGGYETRVEEAYDTPWTKAPPGGASPGGATMCEPPECPQGRRAVLDGGRWRRPVTPCSRCAPAPPARLAAENDLQGLLATIPTHMLQNAGLAHQHTFYQDCTHFCQPGPQDAKARGTATESSS